MKIFCLNSSDQQVFVQRLKVFFETSQSLVLLNSQWGEHECNQVRQILGKSANLSDDLFNDETTEIDLSFSTEISAPIYLIPTGGTSGKIKFAVHNFATLAASVAGFREFFELDRVHCFCVLPLYHVGGLMQWWRSQLSGGQFYLGNYGELKRGILPEGDFGDFCLSLVPTQLQVLLDVCPQWLQQFRLVLVGGAPSWRSLLTQARAANIRIALTYGMTETASQVIALKPEDFLAGKDCAGQVLPHADVQVDQGGLISIGAKSLFFGYFPQINQPQQLVTDDLGYFDEASFLQIVGRQSQKIISGGENIYPTEIEAVIRGTGLVQDVAVCGLPDAYWGERVTAVLVLRSGVTLAALQGAIADQLSRYQIPKKWCCVAALPRNAQGKLNQTILRAMIEKDYR